MSCVITKAARDRNSNPDTFSIAVDVCKEKFNYEYLSSILFIIIYIYAYCLFIAEGVLRH